MFESKDSEDDDVIMAEDCATIDESSNITSKQRSDLNKNVEESLNRNSESFLGVSKISNEDNNPKTNASHAIKCGRLSFNTDDKISLNEDDKISLSDHDENSLIESNKIQSKEEENDLDSVINSMDDDDITINEDDDIETRRLKNLDRNQKMLQALFDKTSASEDDAQQDNSLEAIRKRNIQRNKEIFAQLFPDEYGDKAKPKDIVKTKPVYKRKYVQNSNPQPVEKRRSLRVRGEPVKYNEYELDKLLDNDDKPKHRKTIGPVTHGFKYLLTQKFPKLNGRRTAIPELPVSEVTQRHIDNIAVRAIEKTYSKEGSSCHQCRQKTIDTKTFCRSGICTGVRGQFCGPCLDGRYGESVADALRDPNWSCPPCRGICNCSICLTRQGYAPTGILRPVALEKGYKSVKHYLEAITNDSDGENSTKSERKLIKAKTILEELDEFSELELDVFYGFE